MTRRRFFLAHIRSVAIRTTTRLLKLLELFFDRRDFLIGRLFVVLVTSNTRSDRNIRSQTAQSAGASNVDVAGRAFHDVLAFAALVTEPRGLTRRQPHCHERSGRLMATRAVVAGWSLILPMAVEARVMTAGQGFERSYRRFENIGRAWGCANDRVVCEVAYRAVVILKLLLVVTLRFEERGAHEARCSVRTATGAKSSNHVLMFVVRKLDGELPFIFWFGGLAGAIRFAENEAPSFAWRGAHVTDRTDSRTRAGERLPREKLLSVTTNAGIMVWKISDIRKITLCGPCRGNFVTGIASQTLVFVG